MRGASGIAAQRGKAVEPEGSNWRRRNALNAHRVPTHAPEVGFEPTTNRLTADRSTTELLRIWRIPHHRMARGRQRWFGVTSWQAIFWGNHLTHRTGSPSVRTKIRPGFEPSRLEILSRPRTPRSFTQVVRKVFSPLGQRPAPHPAVGPSDSPARGLPLSTLRPLFRKSCLNV